MKLEMGESLMYSWMRHIKQCQVVQSNWKVSPKWQLEDQEQLEKMMKLLDQHYREKHGYSIFKKNILLKQLLRQGECDLLGMCARKESSAYYAAEIAFHENGLSYGSRQATVMKVMEKLARTALCLQGYFSTKKAEILFASPKITPAVLTELISCTEEMNRLFIENGYAFTFGIVANEDFNKLILQPVLSLGRDVADTSELFLRSYQMYQMFHQETGNNH